MNRKAVEQVSRACSLCALDTFGWADPIEDLAPSWVLGLWDGVAEQGDFDSLVLACLLDHPSVARIGAVEDQMAGTDLEVADPYPFPYPYPCPSTLVYPLGHA